MLCTQSTVPASYGTGTWYRHAAGTILFLLEQAKTKREEKKDKCPLWRHVPVLGTGCIVYSTWRLFQIGTGCTTIWMEPQGSGKLPQKCQMIAGFWERSVYGSWPQIALKPGSSPLERPGLDIIRSQPWFDATCPRIAFSGACFHFAKLVLSKKKRQSTGSGDMGAGCVRSWLIRSRSRGQEPGFEVIRGQNALLFAINTGNSSLELLLTGNIKLTLLLDGLLAQIHMDLSSRVFGRNRTGDLWIPAFL